MLERVVSKFIAHYLKEYIEEISSSQMAMELWKGHAKLENLSILPTALSHHNIPLKVIKGTIRSIRLNFPWKALNTESCFVDVNDVFILCEIDSDALADYDIFADHDAISGLESINLPSREDRKGAWASLIDTVIDNFRVNIQNVHVRIEIPYEHSLVALGFVLPQLAVFTISEERKMLMSVQRGEFLRKQLSLSNVSTYLDVHTDPVIIEEFEMQMSVLMSAHLHQNLINPVILECILTYDRRSGADFRTVVESNISQILFSMDLMQATALRRISNKWARYQIQRKFAHCKRPDPFVPSLDVWKYANKCALDIASPQRFSPSLAVVILKNRKEYMKITKGKFNPIDLITKKRSPRKTIEMLEADIGEDATYYLRQYANALQKSVTNDFDSLDFSELKGLAKGVNVSDFDKFKFSFNVDLIQAEIMYIKGSPLMRMDLARVLTNAESIPDVFKGSLSLSTMSVKSFNNGVVNMVASVDPSGRENFFELNVMRPSVGLMDINLFVVPTKISIDSVTTDRLKEFFGVNDTLSTSPNIPHIIEANIHMDLQELDVSIPGDLSFKVSDTLIDHVSVSKVTSKLDTSFKVTASAGAKNIIQESSITINSLIEQPSESRKLRLSSSVDIESLIADLRGDIFSNLCDIAKSMLTGDALDIDNSLSASISQLVVLLGDDSEDITMRIEGIDIQDKNDGSTSLWIQALDIENLITIAKGGGISANLTKSGASMTIKSPQIRSNFIIMSKLLTLSNSLLDLLPKDKEMTEQNLDFQIVSPEIDIGSGVLIKLAQVEASEETIKLTDLSITNEDRIILNPLSLDLKLDGATVLDMDNICFTATPKDFKALVISAFSSLDLYDQIYQPQTTQTSEKDIITLQNLSIILLDDERDAVKGQIEALVIERTSESIRLSMNSLDMNFWNFEKYSTLTHIPDLVVTIDFSSNGYILGLNIDSLSINVNYPLLEFLLSFIPDMPPSDAWYRMSLGNINISIHTCFGVTMVVMADAMKIMMDPYGDITFYNLSIESDFVPNRHLLSLGDSSDLVIKSTEQGYLLDIENVEITLNSTIASSMLDFAGLLDQSSDSSFPLCINNNKLSLYFYDSHNFHAMLIKMNNILYKTSEQESMTIDHITGMLRLGNRYIDFMDIPHLEMTNSDITIANVDISYSPSVTITLLSIFEGFENVIQAQAHNKNNEQAQAESQTASFEKSQYHSASEKPDDSSPLKSETTSSEDSLQPQSANQGSPKSISPQPYALTILKTSVSVSAAPGFPVFATFILEDMKISSSPLGLTTRISMLPEFISPFEVRINETEIVTTPIHVTYDKSLVKLASLIPVSDSNSVPDFKMSVTIPVLSFQIHMDPYPVNISLSLQLSSDNVKVSSLKVWIGKFPPILRDLDLSLNLKKNHLTLGTLDLIFSEPDVLELSEAIGELMQILPSSPPSAPVIPSLISLSEVTIIYASDSRSSSLPIPLVRAKLPPLSLSLSESLCPIITPSIELFDSKRGKWDLVSASAPIIVSLSKSYKLSLSLPSGVSLAVPLLPAILDDVPEPRPPGDRPDLWIYNLLDIDCKISAGRAVFVISPGQRVPIFGVDGEVPVSIVYNDKEYIYDSPFPTLLSPSIAARRQGLEGGLMVIFSSPVLIRNLTKEAFTVYTKDDKRGCFTSLERTEPTQMVSLMFPSTRPREVLFVCDAHPNNGFKHRVVVIPPNGGATSVIEVFLEKGRGYLLKRPVEEGSAIVINITYATVFVNKLPYSIDLDGNGTVRSGEQVPMPYVDPSSKKSQLLIDKVPMVPGKRVPFRHGFVIINAEKDDKGVMILCLSATYIITSHFPIEIKFNNEEYLIQSLEPTPIVTEQKAETFSIRSPGETYTDPIQLSHTGYSKRFMQVQEDIYGVSIAYQDGEINVTPLLFIENYLHSDVLVQPVSQEDSDPWEPGRDIDFKPILTIEPGTKACLVSIVPGGFFRVCLSGYESVPRVNFLHARDIVFRFTRVGGYQIVYLKIREFRGMYYATFYEEFTSPYVIVNLLEDETILAWQTADSLPIVCPPMTSTYLPLDEPDWDKLINFTFNKVFVTADVDTECPLQYTDFTYKGKKVVYGVVNRNSGKNLIIGLEDDLLEDSWITDPDPIFSPSISVEIPHIYIPLVSPNLREIAHLTISGFVFNADRQSLSLDIGSLQLDDSNAHSPIPPCLYIHGDTDSPSISLRVVLPSTRPSIVSLSLSHITLSLSPPFLYELSQLTLPSIKIPSSGKPSPLIQVCWLEISPTIINVCLRDSRDRPTTNPPLPSLLRLLPSVSPKVIPLPGLLIAASADSPRALIESAAGDYEAAALDEVLTGLGLRGRTLDALGLRDSIAQRLGIGGLREPTLPDKGSAKSARIEVQKIGFPVPRVLEGIEKDEFYLRGSAVLIKNLKEETSAWPTSRIRTPMAFLRGVIGEFDEEAALGQFAIQRSQMNERARLSVRCGKTNDYILLTDNFIFVLRPDLESVTREIKMTDVAEIKVAGAEIRIDGRRDAESVTFRCSGGEKEASQVVTFIQSQRLMHSMFGRSVM